MKQISGYEVKEFTYESKIFRDHHVTEMEEQGWEANPRKRLRDGVSIMDATHEDYEWYSHFRRFTI